jgi:hypothetical protein
MPFGLGIKGALYLGTALFVALIVGAGYLYVSNLQSKVELLTEERAAFKLAFEGEQAAHRQTTHRLDDFADQLQRQVQVVEELGRVSREANSELQRVTGTLSRHDIGGLATANPAAITRIINSGTADWVRNIQGASNIVQRHGAGSSGGPGDNPAPSGAADP